MVRGRCRGIPPSRLYTASFRHCHVTPTQWYVQGFILNCASYSCIAFLFLMVVDVSVSPRAGIQGSGASFLQLKPPLLCLLQVWVFILAIFFCWVPWVLKRQVMKQGESCQLNKHHRLTSCFSLCHFLKSCCLETLSFFFTFLTMYLLLKTWKPQAL